MKKEVFTKSIIKEKEPNENRRVSVYRKEIPWEDFEKRYFEFLAEMKFLNRLLMCVEETPEKCHRRFLAEEL
ncbi:DUF488 domain-containing protein [Patescibacteria group bacterium]|nr:DUF488 domain-containing protein [Patescibacteria group bacterium]MBU1246471.1 DUF488 domain-containing protein [Patescibacteria group bacterium]MBU1519233.1 DUF488 domain-containing protein [Patescibacteria group bacterium]MBU2009907.1 DUF488 domain-containing protein [Patescibacteria group bacterium]MBU2416954.1 DUF488 domain-containing protein [Patescibacteria group bacterium]